MSVCCAQAVAVVCCTEVLLSRLFVFSRPANSLVVVHIVAKLNLICSLESFTLFVVTFVFVVQRWLTASLSAMRSVSHLELGSLEFCLAPNELKGGQRI